MSRGSRALKRIKDFLVVNTKHWKQDVGYIEEELKALEIIKKYFWLEDFQDFIAFNGRLPKSLKEECDLLRGKL